MDVVLGRNVTLRTLRVKPSYMFIVWTYNNGEDQVHVATLSDSGLKVSTLYEGRVSIEPNTGSLFLGEAKSEDSGDFGISVISKDGETKTAEIKLRVLGECFRSAPGPRLGAPFCRSPLKHGGFHGATVRALLLLFFFFFYPSLIFEVFNCFQSSRSANSCCIVFISFF